MNKKGFTLLELLVVVLIIGILAAIALPQYRKAVAKAELAQIVSMVKSIKQAQERYYLTNDQYTSNLQVLDIDVKGVSCGTFFYSNALQAYCNNKNFTIWIYGKYVECAAKTNSKDNPLSDACKDFTKNGTGQSCSTCASCDKVGLNPCYVYKGSNML